MRAYKLYPLGENAVLIEFGTEIDTKTHQKIQVISAFLNENPPEWMVEYIPAFTTITIFYDPIYVSTITNMDLFDYVCLRLTACFQRSRLNMQMNRELLRSLFVTEGNLVLI